MERYRSNDIQQKQAQEELKKKLNDLKDEQAALEVDANKLQDPDYIARYAREKYSYSKDGEIFINLS